MSLWTKGIVSNDSEVVTNVCIPQLMGNTTEEKGKGRDERDSWPLLKGDQVSISLFLRRNILYRPVLGGPRAFVYVCVVAVRYVVGCRLRFLYSAVVLSSSFSKRSNLFLYAGESLRSKFVEGNQHIFPLAFVYVCVVAVDTTGPMFWGGQ